MSLFDIFKKKEVVAEPKQLYFDDSSLSYGAVYPIVNKKWDGEKTLGELGVIIKNIPDYNRLRLRSYDAYATKDIVRIIASKHFNWTIGSGLKLQLEPNRTYLESQGIKNFDFEAYKKQVESRFLLYTNSKHCDYLKEKNLGQLALDFFKAKYLGGDCLCVVRYGKQGINVQFIAGEHIQTPFENKSKNRIEHGVEIDAGGRHIAYHVNTKPKSNDSLIEYERIPAYGEKTGKRLAWLIVGEKISPDQVRGVPAISQSLETINKLDRYVESSVTKAEQASNVVYTVNHGKNSTGESPTDDLLGKKKGLLKPDNQDSQVLGDGLANKIANQTSGIAYNMPIDSELKSFSTDIETDFGVFYNSIFNILASGQDVPPEVAMQKFSSNYSASRAAINSFTYLIGINRDLFVEQFYKPFFKSN